MKTCPVCALDLEDSFLYCPDDGSTLTFLGRGPHGDADLSDDSPDNEKPGGVVLYCPTCAAEYPLTFSSCPVHGVPLTTHHIPKPPSPEPDPPDRQVVSQSTITRQPEAQDQPGAAIPAKVLDFKRAVAAAQSPQFTGLSRESTSVRDDVEDRPGEDFRGAPVETDENVVGIHAAAYEDDNFHRTASGSHHRGRASGHHERAIDRYERELDSLTASHDEEPESTAHELRLDRPGFRVAATITAIALGVFALAAIYNLVTNFARRSTPTSNKTVSAKRDTSAPQPFIATPLEAQEYQEKAPDAPLREEPLAQPARQPEQTHEPRVEPPRRERTSLPATENAVPVKPDVRPAPKSQPSEAASPPTPAPRASTSAMPPVPKDNSAGFDARLIRVRSRQTPAGVRYDLTFNMQEQAGRPALWQRLLISTRAASGASHSEAIPFSHRLGPSGALTFTISVEMTGRSEADWRGRINCTTLGWDLKGGLLQTSFGANVTP